MREKGKTKATFFTASRLASIAVFSALSGVLYAFGFSIPVLFAPWLELNFSDVPLLVGSFALGTPSGCCIVVLRTLIKLLLRPTSTAFVGEAADILMGLALCIPSGLIYGRKKTLRGAIAAVLVGGLCSSVAAVAVNRFMIIPFYVTAMRLDLSSLANMLRALYPSCTEQTFYRYYLWLSVFPFNLLRCVVAALLTFAVYKKISVLIKRLDEKLNGKRKAEVKNTKNDEADG